MDYSNIEILEFRWGGLKAFEARAKLDRMLFVLSLYPDWRLATKFADIGNWHDFLPYWIGEEQWGELQENVRERRKQIRDSDEDIFAILENAYKKYSEGGDHLSPYLNDERIIEREIDDTVEIVTEPVLTALGLNEKLSPFEVLEKLDVLIAIEKTKGTKNIEFDIGRYWIVSYTQELIGSEARPFVMLAKMDDDEIQYLQGAWPQKHMKNMIDGIVPYPYYSSLQDMKFISIELVNIKTVRDGKEIEIVPLYGYRYKIDECQ